MSDQIARTEKQLGAILRRARKQAGMTQTALANHIHLRQGTVSRLESGEPHATFAGQHRYGLDAGLRARS